VECFDTVSGSRGNQLVAWSWYALVGFVEGYFTASTFPDVDYSWARFVWIVPVSLCVILFFSEYRTFPQVAVGEFLVIDPYSASRGFISGFVTAPTFATCWYSFGIWIAPASGQADSRHAAPRGKPDEGEDEARQEGEVTLGRNEPCHCGSGLKYKHCCLAKDETAEQEELERAARRAGNIDGVTVDIFEHAIGRVRAYSPNRLRKSR
jgi:hypothetical protein